MKRILLALLTLPLSCLAQRSPATPPASLYLDTPALDYRRLLPPPPAPHSPAADLDSSTLHKVQDTRTPAEVRQAQLDDHEEDIFLFAGILGPRFDAASLPLTDALSLHIRHESAVVNPTLKDFFSRPRPYVADPTLHPVCDRSVQFSYPSGHAMVGYLEAFALTQIVPEQSAAILRRADAFAHNRLICGVHYPTDIEASRTIALALFGSLSASPRFQKELAAARAETRARLALP